MLKHGVAKITSETPAARAPEHSPAAAALADSEQVRPGGPLYALLAYSIWGIAPAYFVWVGEAVPFEILAYRVLWSIPLLFLLLTIARDWQTLFALKLKSLGALLVSGALIAANWGVYIWAVDSERILETSLGYYLNPLINVLLGVFLLSERLRAWQWLSVGIAAAGVGNEVYVLGAVPWYGLFLAVSFALYGLVRKVARVEPVAGLTVETVLVSPLAVGYLLLIHASGTGVTATGDTALFWMLALGGLVTVVPLLCFTAAALRMPLSILGFFQYLAPTLALLLAVFAFGEPFRAHQFVTFGLIWLALLIFSAEGWWYSKAQRGTPT